jgi:hypothetical protein
MKEGLDQVEAMEAVQVLAVLQAHIQTHNTTHTPMAMQTLHLPVRPQVLVRLLELLALPEDQSPPGNNERIHPLVPVVPVHTIQQMDLQRGLGRELEKRQKRRRKNEKLRRPRKSGRRNSKND